eukprot:3835278-Rhodomonas_salina.1
MSGTDLAYSVMQQVVLRAAPLAMTGTEVAYGAVRLHTCYAMPGSDPVHGAVRLRACYAMSSTEVAYGIGGTKRR